MLNSAVGSVEAALLIPNMCVCVWDVQVVVFLSSFCLNDYDLNKPKQHF